MKKVKIEIVAEEQESNNIKPILGYNYYKKI